MAQTLVCLDVHIVFSTKHRANLILPEVEPALFSYVAGIVANLGSRCLAINGTENHVHLLVSLSKTRALCDFVREVKKGSSQWMNETRSARRHFGWQDGYGAFAVSRSNVPAVERYIAAQKTHHRRVAFEDEYRALLKKSMVAFDEKYCWG